MRKIGGVDLTGRRFGRWIVIARDGQCSNGDPRWRCHCDCGNEKSVRCWSLIYGDSKSCGCLQRELAYRICKARTGIPVPRARKPDATYLKLFRIYRSVARQRGYEFIITIEQFKELSAKNCYYCNREPSQVYKTDCMQVKRNGIDRIDNSIGYVIENCVPCCRWCNIAKAKMSEAEFLDLVSRIYEHRILRITKTAAA